MGCSNTFVHFPLPADDGMSITSRQTASCPSQVDAHVRELTPSERDYYVDGMPYLPGTVSGSRCKYRFRTCPGHADEGITMCGRARAGPCSHCPGPCIKF